MGNESGLELMANRFHVLTKTMNHKCHCPPSVGVIQRNLHKGTRVSFTTWILPALACLCILGCRTSTTVKEAEGTTKAHVFQASLDEAWETCLQAVSSTYKITETNKANGTFLFNESAGAFEVAVTGEWGVVGGVFLKPVNDTSTSIEVVVKQRRRGLRALGLESLVDPSEGRLPGSAREIYKKIAAKHRMLE